MADQTIFSLSGNQNREFERVRKVVVNSKGRNSPKDRERERERVVRRNLWKVERVIKQREREREKKKSNAERKRKKIKHREREREIKHRVKVLIQCVENL